MLSMWLNPLENLSQFLIGLFLIFSSIGVISLRNPVHSSLSFLLTLLLLASLYVQLSAEFIGIIQVLVYAGAILVIFMFVIILFQDAHQKIEKVKAKTPKWLVYSSALAFSLAIGLFIFQIFGIKVENQTLTVQKLGEALYIDFFFPFEAVTFLFLVAIVGSLYIGKKPSGAAS